MKIITLAEGAGGSEMQKLISGFSFPKGNWKGTDGDSAHLNIEGLKGNNLVFTTDSFTVSPVFFPGGDIGHLAFSGTVNDLLMSGAIPLGLSLSLVIEEGFPCASLERIIKTIKGLSERYGIPIVTGDTKVMDKGKVDGIVINTSAVGITDKVIDGRIIPGDRVIISGGIGEHAIALLGKRFDYETDIVSDSKPLIEEMDGIKALIKKSKDPTRGGLASSLNEVAARAKLGIRIYEDKLPIKEGVMSVSKMLGIDPLQLACEGRLVCIASEANADLVRDILRKHNPLAEIIGEVTIGDKVLLKTAFGESIINMPSGRLIPRIC